MRRRILASLLLLMSSYGYAVEGMWQPHQLPQLGAQLKELGLKIDPEKLAGLSDFPMNAIVSLGGCSASFVSPKGLVATNHHCVYGSLQYASTPENNVLENGFVASSLEEEVPAAPGSRVYVTEEVTEVTHQVLEGVSDEMSGQARYQQIEDNIKRLIQECEAQGGYRCGVPAYHHGMEYYLVKRLEIRDVRLVYAPPASIGKYGGDIDNWQWPRHTGDFGFYRAYVSPDGKPADYAEENVPYKPANFLRIDASGVKEGDFVMALGYPGRTNRYRTADEVENQFTWFYPNARVIREDLIEVITDSSLPESQARLSYESTIASLANYAKNYRSMVESYGKSDFLQRRQQTEQALTKWIESDADRKMEYGPALHELAQLINTEQAVQARDLILGYMSYAALPTVAESLYRLAVEKQKPDFEREPGYQERDMAQFRQSIQRLSRRFDPQVDKAILQYLLTRYAELPEDQRVDAIDAFYGIDKSTTAEQLQQRIDQLYANTELDQEAARMAWLDRSPEAFRESEDPFIRYAVATHDARMALEEEEEERTGKMQQYRSHYMSAMVDFKRAQNEPVYADANSTLRVTFGTVQGNEPRDGLKNLPFTTLEGILEKNTGEDPFDAPEKQLELIREQTYGPYELESLDSVPVNFLADVDITGGNSGSAIMNGEAQLVGLLFDGVYESIIGDWDFDEEKNRAIAVDARYMLWVMKYVDGAENLLKELTIVE
ncbi:S46 family peptidase [Proteobacteria bacterium 005FR1]|nr:S46 family peptidase [Proteobacteria bacterium 005FR1]